MTSTVRGSSEVPEEDPRAQSASDYATLNFQRSRSDQRQQPPENMVAPPKRGIKPYKNIQQSSNYRHNQKNLNNNSARIYQNVGPHGLMLTHRQVESHLDPSEEDEHDERDRTFATAICIFSSVLTMVLVLMFYLVGEAAFRSILLILSFVFIITLLLACFLRRPSAIIFTNSPIPVVNAPSAASGVSSQNGASKTYHQYSKQQPHVFMLVPPSTGPTPDPSASMMPYGYCPVHSPLPPRPESSIPGQQTPPPQLPPKSPAIPTPPPIGTIPSRVIHNNSNINHYASSSSSSSSTSSFSHDSLEIIDKIESEKLGLQNHKY